MAEGGSNRAIAAAAVVAVALVAIVLLLAPFGASAKQCSSYPTPGTAAPAGTKVPASLTGRYALFRAPQRALDRVTASQIGTLKASDLIMSGSRFIGDAAFGGRIYLIPAEHLLSLPIAPARCLSRVQRVIEQQSLPVLRSEYRQVGLCVLVIGGSDRQQECGAASGNPYALLFSDGTPGFGLVPNGISAVTVSYWAAPPRTVAVRRNAFVIVAPSQAAPPCGVQWLDATGNVQKVVTGCSFLTVERQELGRYRAYVSGKLRTVRSQLAGLSAAIGSGSLAKARSAWLAAHLTWLEIGQDDGAYGCFGTLGGEIDGLAAGHPEGTSDPGFTGFHRVELELWAKRNLDAAGSATTKLRGLLAQLLAQPLPSYLPATTTGLANWVLRPHEVLEDALRDSLTADDDYGSGTDLASITADIAAVRVMLGELRPQLSKLAPGLVERATGELDALGRAAGAAPQGVPLAKLPTRERQQVDADVDQALETLAPLPDLLTSTGKNAPTG